MMGISRRARFNLDLALPQPFLIVRFAVIAIARKVRAWKRAFFQRAQHNWPFSFRFAFPAFQHRALLFHAKHIYSSIIYRLLTTRAHHCVLNCRRYVLWFDPIRERTIFVSDSVNPGQLAARRKNVYSSDGHTNDRMRWLWIPRYVGHEEILSWR